MRRQSGKLQRLLAKTALTVAIGLALALGGGVAANAAEIKAAPVHACACLSATYPPDAAAESLPLERWRTASTTFHSRFDQWLQNDLAAQAARDTLQGLLMQTGNGSFSITSGLVGLSSTVDPLKVVGWRLDKASASLGDAVLGTGPAAGGLIVILVVWSVAYAIMQLRKGQRPWKRLISVVVIVAALSVITAGGHASDDEHGYEPGFLSPGWIATSLATTTGKIVGIPVSAFLDSTADGVSIAPEGSGCHVYMQTLHSRYRSQTGTSGSMAEVINRYWEGTGLTSWMLSQYSSTPISPDQPGRLYGQDTFCHQLDIQAGIRPDDQAAVTFGSLDAAKRAGYNSKSLAWGADSNDSLDRSLVAWAACRNDGKGAFIVAAGFTAKVTSADCTGWFSGTDTTLRAFDVGGAVSNARDYSDSPAVQDLLKALHGSDLAGSTFVLWLYMCSSFGLGLVFAGVAAIVLLAKLAVVATMLGTIVVLVLALIGRGSEGRIVAFLRMIVGYTVLSAAGSAILAIISLVSSLLVGIATDSLPLGSPLGLVFTGMAPLAAVLLIHLVIVKLLRQPSPFTFSGALAWGGSARTVGTAVTAARRAESKAAGVARAGVVRGTNALKSRVLPGGRTRPGTTQGTQRMTARRAPSAPGTQKPATATGRPTPTSTARPHPRPDRSRTAPGTPAAAATASRDASKAPPRNARAFASRPIDAVLTRANANAQTSAASAMNAARLRRGREALAVTTSAAMRTRAADVAPASTVSFFGPALKLALPAAAKTSDGSAEPMRLQNSIQRRRPDTTERTTLPATKVTAFASAVRRPGHGA